MPLPRNDNSSDEDGSSGASNPKLQFSYVECLMFTFHQLGRFKPAFLTSEESSEKLKDFRLRLPFVTENLCLDS